MKIFILPGAAIFLLGLFVNHFMIDEDLGERVVLSKSAKAVISEQAKLDKLGYAERNIAINKLSELNARKKEFDFEKPCAKEENSATMDSASFVTYKNQVSSVFNEPDMMAKLDASQETIDNMREKIKDMNRSNMDSKLVMILKDLENLVNMQNYFAQEILKKLPENNDFSYLIAQKIIEDKMADLLPLNVLIFCRGYNSSGCDLVKNEVKKAVDSDSLLFANNIDNNIYFNYLNSTEGQNIINSDLIACKTDINVYKLALQNRFSSLYEQNMNDSLKLAKISPFNL